MSPILGKRVRRWLDAAWARGAFDVNGSLGDLSAGFIADNIAADWNTKDIVVLFTGEEIEPFVVTWLARNSERV